MNELANWTADTAVAEGAPLVRVGIVLPEDGVMTLHLLLPPAAYKLSDSTGAAREISNVALDCRIDGDGVRAVVDGAGGETAASWTLSPAEAGSGGIRSDAPAVRVEGIVAGRGFHWETTTRQSLPGEMIVSNHQGRLLLIARLPLDDYLAGVITAEMSGQCPVDFLKAQCVVARSWALACTERKHDDLGFDLCNDDCCQRYQGIDAMTESARLAVEQTRGEALVVDPPAVPRRVVVDANYSKSCGGVSERPEVVWNLTKPGLSAVVDAPANSALHQRKPVGDENIAPFVDPEDQANNDAFCSPAAIREGDLPRYLGRVDTGGGFFRWTVSYERRELEKLLARKNHAPEDLARLMDLVVTKRGVSGRAVELELVYRTHAGDRAVARIADQYVIREALHNKFLYSSAFRVRVDRQPPTPDGEATRFHFDGAGWGHGAGLCQIGALGMALAGHDYRAILTHYFPTADLATVYR